MTVLHKHIGSKGLFYMEADDEIVARMIYTNPSGGILLIEHIQIDEALQGLNIGYELVHAAVEYARHHKICIIASCSFAKNLFSKKPEWQDVLKN